MPLSTVTGKVLLVGALAGVAWGGLQTLKQIRANAQLVTITAERDQALGTVSTLTATVSTLTAERDAAVSAAALAQRQRNAARRQLQDARNDLDQALRAHPDWADDPVPDSVRDALRPRTP